VILLLNVSTHMVMLARTIEKQLYKFYVMLHFSESGNIKYNISGDTFCKVQLMQKFYLVAVQ
jgi:hypothetical protein